MGELTVNRIIQNPMRDWSAEAAAAAVAEARRIACTFDWSRSIGRMTDQEWGILFAGALGEWLRVRHAQAVAEGLERNGVLELPPSLGDVAAVQSVLPALADRAGIDWSWPMRAWSKETMTHFLLLAWRLINEADIARGPIVARRPGEHDEDVGDPSYLDRDTFVLTLRPELDVDPIRSLRWVLKRLLRQFGMRCTDLHCGKKPHAGSEQRDSRGAAA
jgi:hypothetical protein